MHVLGLCSLEVKSDLLVRTTKSFSDIAKVSEEKARLFQLRTANMDGKRPQNFLNIPAGVTFT